jgi:V/A-type H+-transporting ATPase subunit I
MRLGGGLWGLYEWVLGLFGDIMSYLRIFGLGLSSGIIALVVNTIALMMMEGGSIGGIIGGVLVLLIGHTFNFAMAVLGSTVHSARLQFLEFFGKFFEGGGQPFSPFARTK